MGIDALGKLLLVFGLVIVAIGVLLIFAARIPFFGRLPGDIFVRRDGFSLYFPIVSFILLSIILTVIINVVIRIFGK